MSGADAVSDADMPPRVAPMATASDLRPRRGLFRKYIVALVVLVAAALCVNAGVEFWFSFRESKAALLALQQEKADAAAQRIGEFVTGVERQIGWTTLPLWGAAPIDQRRFDFVRLLRQVPAITDLTELDGDGKEQLKVSRLAMDVVGSGADYSHAPEFVEARANGSWFSPVSFRKESEPYMTLALADAGRNSGVTVASINLKLIWDVITALKIGEGGYAYVVDGRGKLIADPDISLVLRDTDFSKLPQVAAALAAASADGETAQTQAVTAADDYYGRPVLSAHARIKPVGWRVFVEVPLKEAYAPLYALALRNVLWLVLALSGAALAAFLLARRMISPIHALQAGAAQIGAGDLDRRIDIRTGDELEGLANQFNRMAADLETSYAELERRVEERTAELSEALDQQTATAEVLGVINSSPGELAPVFDAMLEKATKLCDAALGAMFRYDGARMNLAAMRGLPLADSGFFHSWVPGEGDVMYAIVHGAPLIHVLDIVDTDAYRSGIKSRVRMVEVTGARTAVWVPLRKDDVLLGVIIAYRREVRPFTDKQIALLQNFAAQAVIAMENARLITETREALDQQTATAEVLGVINASPGNLAPVFDAMLERAVRLCEADTGHLFRFENGAFLRLASRGVAEDFDELFPPESPVPMDPNSVPARMIATRSVVHVHDTREDESFTVYRTRDEVAAVEAGILTVLFVPLIKEGEVVGHFTMHRMEVRPFTDKQIALVQNFAAQAVIAMENARLITETQEALDQQTATAEVLQVINANSGDLQPVFDVILEKAMALCDVAYGDLELYDGATFRAVATRGLTDAFAEQVRRGYPAGEGTGLGLSISYDIVTQQHGGTIAIDSAEDEFTEFTIRLPRQTTGSGASA
jgi:GAF domain-containing protein